MTATMNAGGGDWLDLPTQPVQHRGGKRPEGLPWAQITEAYVANGGQVDAGVWPEIKGKITTLGAHGRSHKALHTLEEAVIDGDYENDLSRGVPARKPASRALLSKDAQRKVCLRYRRDELTIRELATAFGVSITAIRTALIAQGEPFRTRSEAQRIRAGRAS